MPRKLTKILSSFLCFLFIFQQSGFTQIAGELDLSSHFLNLQNNFIQDRFRPLHLRYLSYDALSNNFNLLLDKGDFVKGLSPWEASTKEDKGTVPEEILQRETKTLLNYFFIGVSLPNEAFWVNLRPDSPDNIIDPELAETDVGKILLEADLQLKKDTANFTSPQTPEGKDYWDKLYKKAEEIYGSENITIPTLARPWIVPDEIIIRESSDNAYIYKATLKVMLEQDYLKDSSTYSFPDQRSKALNEYSSQLIRETIIPKLTKEINSSKRYAPLRQVYYSLILAQWFKQKFYGKSGVYSYLIDRHKLDGLTSKTPWSKTTYFNAYKTSFQQGEYNIKEPRSTLYGQSIRSYMSGGIALAPVSSAISAGIVQSTRGDFGHAPYTMYLNTKGGSVSSPFDVEIEAVALANEQPPAAFSPAAGTVVASPAVQESSASSSVQGAALVDLPTPQVQVITALQPDLNVSLSNEKTQFTIYKDEENKPGQLRIRQKDVMKENIAENEFDARRIFPLLSVGDKTLEKELRKDIAKIIRESFADHDDFYMNYSPDHWSRPQYKKMVEDFRSKGINLESYEGLEADIMKAFREAIWYYSDAFGNVFGQEMKVLRYYQTSNRFLRLGHPIAVRLQKLLDKMAEGGLPVARILVAIDGEEPLAFSIGQTVVINLALIMGLDTIDEVAAVLAHEQGHVEFNLARERGQKDHREHSFVEDISAGRLQEHGADLVTTTKLAKLGLYSLALPDVLRKIAGGSSQQDIVHGSISNRIVSVIGYHRFHDVEAGMSQAGQNMDIPDNWLLSKVTPSIKERIFNKEYGTDFQTAVGEASYQLVEEAMNEFVRKLSYSEPKDNDYGEIAEKLLYVMNFCIDRISIESAKENWPQGKKEAVVLSLLMNRGRSSGWEKIYNKDVASMQNPSAQEQIIGILRQPALFLLQSSDCVKILEELKGSSYMGQLIDANSQDSSADFLAALLINDKWVTSQVIGNAYNINQKSYLTIFNTYLSRLVGLKQEHERKKWLGDWIKKIIGRYVENFWKNHERSKENLLMLTEHLKETNTEYAKMLGLESVKDLQFLYNSHVLFSSWSRQLYDAIINNVNISQTELINIIFGIQDDVLRECINVLKSKDEQLFFSFLNLYPMVFLEYLNSMDKREADPGLKKLFQDDPKLSEWLFSILSKQWATNALKLPPDYRNDDFDKRWPNDEEKLLDYLEFTHYFRDDESKQKYKRFMFGLEAVKLLPVSDRERRFSMIKTYVNSGKAKLFVNGLSLRNMSYVIQDLEEIFKQNVEQEYTVSLLDKRYEDKMINFAVYWLLRDRLLSHIKPTVSLELAEKIYWFIGKYSNTVYGSINLGGAIAGNSEAHSLWLVPVNKAYLNYLGERKDLAVSFASPEISIRYYFALRGILPSGETKEHILVAFAKRLIEQLSDEHVVAFLTELSEKGDINREIYGHFVKKRVNMKDKFLYFKKYRDKYLQRLASVGSVKLLALMVGDNLVDMLLKNDLATEVFEAMLGSGKSDEELQKLLVTPWFFAMVAYGAGKQFKIEYEGGSVEVVGVGRGNFIPFREFMDMLYDSPAPVKFMLMNKLLLSPRGVLQTQEGLKQFARIICKYLPEDGQLSDLLRSVLESSVSVIDAERLFLSLANSLSTIFLQKPEGGSDTLMSEALSEALAANIDRLNTWDVFKSFAPDKLKKAKKDELGRFLRKYEERIDHTEIVKRIEPLIDSLGEKLEEELNIAPASKSSIPGGIAKYSTLEAIDIVLETCQSLGPVGVRFLQVLGQYLPLSPEYQDRFRDVYDAAEGQDKFTAWDTILKVSELDQEVAKFIEEDLVSIDETLGGGSIVTVFSDTVRNRDLDGNLTEGTHKEVLKIRNPNAEAFVNEVSDKAIKVIEHLENKASRADRKNYNIAKQLLKDIREWVIQDIRDTSFMELDFKYQRAHDDYSASNDMKVRVPSALRPNNKDIKREVYVEGVTLNKVLKLKLSSKPSEQLIEEESNPEVRRLLINLRKNTPAEEGVAILSKVFREATRALVEDFSRHLVQPIFTREDGQEVYLLHSDIHLGNAILSPDAKTVYPIDRNFYLQLDKKDAEFIRKICTLSPDNEHELLNTIVGYFINIAENSNRLSRFTPFNKLRQKFMTMRIGVAIKLSGEKDPLANMVKILQVLESYNFTIPLKIRIMFKNLISIRGMLKESEAGEFSDYLLDAGQRYNNTAILSAAEIKEAKNTAGSPVADVVKAAVVSPVQGFLGRPADGIVFPPDLPQEQIEKIRHSEGGKRMLREKNGEIKIQESPWIQINSRFNEINTSFKDILGGELFDKISALAESRKEKPVYIVGWGAGDLTEIMDLHDRLKAKDINNVFILAFGDTFYLPSKPIPDNILFIVDTDTKLQERIKEFLGNGKVDIIYSYTSLWHLLPAHNEDSAKLKRFLGHLRELENLLTEDGFIVFDFVPEQHGWGGYIQQYSSQNGRALTVKTYNAETGAALLIRSKVAAGSPAKSRSSDTVKADGEFRVTTIGELIKQGLTQKEIEDRIDRINKSAGWDLINKDIKKRLQSPANLNFIAIDTSGQIIGYLLMLLKDESTAHIEYLAKDTGSESQETKGCARLLIRAAIQKASSLGRSKIKISYEEDKFGGYYEKIFEEMKLKLVPGHFGTTGSMFITAEFTIPQEEKQGKNSASPLGGIDLTHLPIVTQAVTNLTANLRDSPLRGQSLSRLSTVNLDEEWKDIERLASSGITPSAERIKEYLQASSCIQQEIKEEDIEKVILCISDILRMEEEHCYSTDPMLKDILIVLESVASGNQLKEIFLGKKT